MGVRAVIYYMVTTLIAVFIGIVIVILIKPGKGNRDSPLTNNGNIEPVQTVDAFLDLVRYHSCFQYIDIHTPSGEVRTKKFPGTQNGMHLGFFFFFLLRHYD